MEDFALKIEKITPVGDEARCGVFTRRVTLADGSLGTVVSAVWIGSENQGGQAELIKDTFDLIGEKIEDGASGSLEVVALAGDSCSSFLKAKKVEFAVGILFFYKSVCYVARAGEKIKVWVFEDGKSAQLKFESGSGPLLGGQIYLVANEKYLAGFESKVFLRTVDEGEFEEIVDGLVTDSAAKSENDLAAAFVYVKGEIEDKEGAEGTMGLKHTESTDESPLRPFDPSTSLRTQSFEGQAPLRQGSAGQAEEGRASRRWRLNVKNPLPAIIRVVVLELGKLRRGDLGAVFRLRRSLVIVAFILIVVLAVSAFWAIKEKRGAARAAEFESHLTLASSKFSEALAIAELNRQRAREILVEAEKEIKLVLTLKSDDERAQKLAGDISEKLKETEVTSNISFENAFEAPESLVSAAFADKSLYGFGASKIWQINPADYGALEIAGVSQAGSGFVFDKKGFVLSEGAIWRVDLAGAKSEKIIESVDGWDIAVFIGNIYLVSGKQILKYSPIENGYVPAVSYLASEVEFNSSSRIAIDGFVWATNGPKVLKFLRGEKQDFEISGVSGNVGNLGPIYTTSQLNNLYIVDLANSALLVIDKEGVFKRAYQSEEFKRASDLVIDESEKKLYLAVDNKILTAELE